MILTGKSNLLVRGEFNVENQIKPRIRGDKPVDSTEYFFVQAGTG